MASREWPRPIITAMTVIEGATVPLSQPSASGLKCRLLGTGSGTGLKPLVKIVARHQTISITTMTVVICMMRRAFSLDSCMPMMFLRQK